MDKKNKVILGLAVGAVAILIASGIARCSLQQQGPDESTAPLEPAAEEAASTEDGHGIAELYGTVWEADDGKSTLTMTDGVLIVNAGEESKALYFNVAHESADDSGISATIAVSETPGGERRETTLAVTKGASSMRLACDALESVYVLETGDASIELVNVDAQLSEIFGVPEPEFETAISEWASTRSPYATKAAWSGEIWIDCRAGTYVTTFTLDDAARTIVTAQKDTDGKLTVL